MLKGMKPEAVEDTEKCQLIACEHELDELIAEEDGDICCGVFGMIYLLLLSPAPYHLYDDKGEQHCQYYRQSFELIMSLQKHIVLSFDTISDIKLKQNRNYFVKFSEGLFFLIEILVNKFSVILAVVRIVTKHSQMRWFVGTQTTEEDNHDFVS